MDSKGKDMCYEESWIYNSDSHMLNNHWLFFTELINKNQVNHKSFSLPGGGCQGDEQGLQDSPYVNDGALFGDEEVHGR